MIKIVSTWDEFLEAWTGGPMRQNILLRGAMFPHQYQAPPIKDVIDAVRQNENARILKGRDGFGVFNEHYPEFRTLPIEQAINATVSLAHFDMRDFTGTGQVFEGLSDVLDHWFQSLTEHGFTYDSSQRAFFYSTPDCNTKYHFDSSYVLVWQVMGRKKFCWLKDPDRWCPRDVLVDAADHYDRMQRPEGITPDDIIECVMEPGDVLWNVMLTPHWVYAHEGPAYSFNVTHFNLRLNGASSPIQEIYEQIHS